MTIFVPSVLIIIVNYNNFSDTIQCLQSLALCSYSNYKICIIDNFSENNSLSEIERFLISTDVNNYCLVRSVCNTGFAGGVNKGLQYAIDNGFDYVLLLNPDTVVEPRFLTNLMKAATEEEKVGIVGGKILFLGSDKLYAAGGRISYFRNIGHNDYYQAKDSTKLKGVMDSFSIVGALMLIDIRLIKDIGFFDEDYFMYLEDTDFCYRAQKAGWKIKVNLDAVIWHKEGGSSNNAFAAYWASKNRLRFIFKNLNGAEMIKAIFLHLLSKPFLYLKLRRLDLIKADIKGFLNYFMQN